MVEYQLTETSAFSSLPEGDQNFKVEEVTGIRLYSIACTAEHQNFLADSLKSCDLELPDICKIESKNNISFFSSGREQWFLKCHNDDFDIASKLKIKLQDKCAITDQSDAWVFLRLSGEDVRHKLSHLSMLDLHPTSFPVDHMARTVMEHLNVIILHESKNVFTLMSNRSSAKSFAHMFT